MQKRIKFARLLLLVFLPILLFSSLHVHQNAVSEDVCYECANHLHHSGHISLQTASFHDCVLCQFVILTFVVATALRCFVPEQSNATVNLIPGEHFLLVVRRPHSPRAPPVI